MSDLQYARDSKKPIYVSTSVYRALWMLGKSRSNELMKITPDEIADITLRTMIDTQHPQLFEHQKKIAKMDDEIIKSLQ